MLYYSITLTLIYGVFQICGLEMGYVTAILTFLTVLCVQQS